MARNPFTPTFGVSPPLLVGRSDLLDDFVVALEDGPGAPGRMTLYTGARGTGKTVMLNEVEDLARQQGLRLISETATEGLVNRLVREHLPALLSDIDPDRLLTPSRTRSIVAEVRCPSGSPGPRAARSTSGVAPTIVLPPSQVVVDELVEQLPEQRAVLGL